VDTIAIDDDVKVLSSKEKQRETSDSQRTRQNQKMTSSKPPGNTAKQLLPNPDGIRQGPPHD